MSKRIIFICLDCSGALGMQSEDLTGSSIRANGTMSGSDYLPSHARLNPINTAAPHWRAEVIAKRLYAWLGECTDLKGPKRFGNMN